jgi:hypothetical protein
MLHSFLLCHSGPKSLVHSHFGFSFSEVAGDTHYTKMQSKVWGKIYPELLFFFWVNFCIVATKKLGSFFFPSINSEKHAKKLENFSKLQKPKNRNNRKKFILIPNRCRLATLHIERRPSGLPKLQRMISGVKTQWLVMFYISFESS